MRDLISKDGVISQIYEKQDGDKFRITIGIRAEKSKQEFRNKFQAIIDQLPHITIQ